MRSLISLSLICVAGWAQFLNPDRDVRMHAADDAIRLLGITEEQAERLFYADEWPEEFLPATAENTAARIRRFIETDGAV